MPAATPKPTLEELLVILTRASNLQAEFSGLDSDTITLKYSFKREHLGPAAKFVFEYPSMIFPTLKELLDFDDVLEKAYRSDDPRNTIEDVIGYIRQKREYMCVLNGLSDKLDAAFFDAALKYLRELDRRRREADRRVKEAAEARRKRNEEEIRERVAEEIRRREEEARRAKVEAHRRWEEEEARKRKWQKDRTSDSGFDPRGKPGYGNPFEEMFRAAGMDPNNQRFKDAFNRASYGGFGYDFCGRWGSGDRKQTPPSGGKRKWYEVLGCAPGATRDQIRAAARKAAKGMHPDIPGQDTPENQERIREINEAKAQGLQGCPV